MSRGTDITAHPGGIAIVGMACRYPGAKNVDEYWRNLCNGVESIRRFSRDELKGLGVTDAMANEPSYVPAGAYIEDRDRFDPTLFGLSDREAEILDPQQRFLLECA